MASAPTSPSPAAGPSLDPDRAAAIAEIAARHPQLELLLLHGSRAGNAAVRADSDWDFAYLAEPPGDGPRFAVHR